MMTKREPASIGLKRVYEAPATDDGVRILVDRVWPRGIAKKALRIDDWAKDVAPSTELRKWFDHDPAKWLEFQERYGRELDRRPTAIAAMLEICRSRPVTLVFSAKDARHNNAVALKAYLIRQM